jgi:hypothetical protein
LKDYSGSFRAEEIGGGKNNEISVLLGWDPDNSHVLTEKAAVLVTDYCPYASQDTPIQAGIHDSASNFLDDSESDSP